MRLRWLVILSALAVVIAGCSGSDVTDTSATPTTDASSGPDEACEGVTLEATDVGVTADTITVTVAADTGSPLRPGLFQGSVDAVEAWADYTNDNGGLACRQVNVKTADSKLSPTDAANAVATACKDSFALVGTTALFLQDVSVLESCKDKAGNATGLPDFANLQTESTQQCSDKSYAVLPNTGSCPYSGTGDRTFNIGTTQYDYYLDKYGADALHGVYVVPKDLNSTIAATIPIYRASEQIGITSDREFGISALATQPDYTPVAQAMKQNKSTYARNNLDYQGTVLMRKEARAQGVDSVEVWDCSVQCYDQKFLSEGGAAVEEQYVWLNQLPLEDKDGVPELQTMYEYHEKNGDEPDGFGEIAWAAGQLFAQAVNDVVEAEGPNGLTRANVLAAVQDIHDFDANGLIPPTDIGAKVTNICIVGMQVQDNKFVRIQPPEPGTFDCGREETVELTMDPLAEFEG